jgi:hypothetical protein
LESATRYAIANDLAYDITTIGVSSIGEGYIYVRLALADEVRSLASTEDDQTVAAIASLGSGQVIVACGDLGIDSYINSHSNARFIENSLGWLAGRVRNWVTIDPAAGVV